MNLSKILLYPFASLYDLVTKTRNQFFDLGIKPQNQVSAPVISVGNLSVGGTGKTPMIDYLIQRFKPNYKVLVISRGYGRKTKGFRELTNTNTADQVGDEPLLFKEKHPEIQVAVAEKRMEAIHRLVKEDSSQLVLLDDAYQHRYVQRDINIQLTALDNLFFEDHVLPMGRLRESRNGAQRADIIVVTKCFDKLDADSIREAISKYSNAPVFFSYIKYADRIISAQDELRLEDLEAKDVLLLSGIAKPQYFEDKLTPHLRAFDTKRFKDHYSFNSQDILNLKSYLGQSSNPIIITTEKDFMRLKDLNWTEEERAKIFYLPIEIDFLFDEKEAFNQLLQQKLDNR